MSHWIKTELHKAAAATKSPDVALFLPFVFPAKFRPIGTLYLTIGGICSILHG